MFTRVLGEHELPARARREITVKNEIGEKALKIVLTDQWIKDRECVEQIVHVFDRQRDWEIKYNRDPVTGVVTWPEGGMPQEDSLSSKALRGERSRRREKPPERQYGGDSAGVTDDAAIELHQGDS